MSFELIILGFWLLFPLCCLGGYFAGLLLFRKKTAKGTKSDISITLKEVEKEVTKHIEEEIASIKETKRPFEGFEFRRIVAHISDCFDTELYEKLVHKIRAQSNEDRFLLSKYNSEKKNIENELKNCFIAFDGYCSELSEFVLTKNGFDSPFMINDQLEILYSMKEDLEKFITGINSLIGSNTSASEDPRWFTVEKKSNLSNSTLINDIHGENKASSEESDNLDFDLSHVSILDIILLVIVFVGVSIDSVLFHSVIANLKVGMDGIYPGSPMDFVMQSVQWIFSIVICCFGSIFMLKGASEFSSRKMRENGKVIVGKFFCRVFPYICLFVITGGLIFWGRLEVDGFVPRIITPFIDHSSVLADPLNTEGQRVVTPSLSFNILLLMLFIGSGISAFIVGEKLAKPEFWDYRKIKKSMSRISGIKGFSKARFDKFYENYVEIEARIKYFEHEISNNTVENEMKEKRHLIESSKHKLIFDSFIHTSRVAGVVIPAEFFDASNVPTKSGVGV